MQRLRQRCSYRVSGHVAGCAPRLKCRLGTLCTCDTRSYKKNEKYPHCHNYLPLNQKSLHAFSGVDFSRVDVTFRICCDHMQVVESTTGMAEKSEMAECLTVRAIHDPYDVVHDIGDINRGLHR